MNKPNDKTEWDAGSRMHVLDWLELPDFMATVRGLIAPCGLTVDDNAARQPKGRKDRGHIESMLVGKAEPFLDDAVQKKLKLWWLKHAEGAKLPTWDLVLKAHDAKGRDALILFEAKAHKSELATSGKSKPKRKTPEQQERSDANHAQITQAIAKANEALRHTIPGIAISVEESYQFANRIAFAWKLASEGTPVALVYLGFVGDDTISGKDDLFIKEDDWKHAFLSHIDQRFPASHTEIEIPCGKASFWLLVRALPVRRSSPPINERRSLK